MLCASGLWDLHKIKIPRYAGAFFIINHEKEKSIYETTFVIVID